MARQSTVGSKVAGMSSEAVQASTGKSWDEWLAILDKEGCRSMSHKEIVAVVSKKYGIGAWWQQMVTVGYEQARGLRAKHQKTDGYQISRSKTLPVPVSKLFQAWNDRRARGRWLADPAFEVRKATTDKSLRVTWVDGVTSVEVMFYPKDDARCQVTVQHNKLPDAAAGERMKAYWGEQLDRLAAYLHGKG